MTLIVSQIRSISMKENFVMIMPRITSQMSITSASTRRLMSSMMNFHHTEYHIRFAISVWRRGDHDKKEGLKDVPRDGEKDPLQLWEEA